MSQQNPKNRRRRRFIDKEFQTRYIVVLGAFVGLAVVAFFLVALLTWEDAGQPTRTIDEKDAFLSLILLLLAAMMLVVVLGLRFSHRIAGPVYALGRNMAYVIQGRLTQDLTLRKGDEFQGLANRFNAMLSTLREREKGDLKALSDARIRADGVAELLDSGADPERIRSELDSLKSSLEELSERKAKYLA